MKYKGVVFNIDNVLYDTKFQKDSARINSIKAMIEAGLPIDIENSFRVLNDIIAKYGVDYPKHFDKMLEKLGIKRQARVIAAGVEGYRENSRVYLQPYPDTIPTIINLRDIGCKVAAISDGNAVKQWQKLIRLGVQHLFHVVLIADEVGKEKVDKKVFQQLLDDLKVLPEETLFVGNTSDEDFRTANRLGLTTVRIRRGATQSEEQKTAEAKPAFEIYVLSEIPKIVKGI
ncbi:HAD family hydrolase [[Eubacterium] cellulosolvens]